MKRALDPGGRGGARRKRHPHPLTTHILNPLGFRVRRNPGRARRVPFFAARRIIEGLGLGLAGRAARKLVPVLTLGVGPVGLPEKTFWGDSLGGARRLRSLP